MAKARKSKKDRPPTKIRGFFADNLRGLRDEFYKHLSDETARNKALGKAISSSASNIARLCAGHSGPSIDYLEWLAEALKVEPKDLVTPYFSNKYKKNNPNSKASDGSKSDDQEPNESGVLQRRKG